MREFAENYAVNRKKIEEIEKTDLQKSKMVRDLYTEHGEEKSSKEKGMQTFTIIWFLCFSPLFILLLVKACMDFSPWKVFLPIGVILAIIILIAWGCKVSKEMSYREEIARKHGIEFPDYGQVYSRNDAERLRILGELKNHENTTEKAFAKLYRELSALQPKAEGPADVSKENEMIQVDLKKSPSCTKCGGELIVNLNSQVYECPFCGVTFDFDFLRDETAIEEARESVFESQFVKADGIWKYILVVEPKNFEALRGRILCAAKWTKIPSENALSSMAKIHFPTLEKRVAEADKSCDDNDKQYFDKFSQIVAEYDKYRKSMNPSEPVRKEHTRLLKKLSDQTDYVHDLAHVEFSLVGDLSEETLVRLYTEKTLETALLAKDFVTAYEYRESLKKEVDVSAGKINEMNEEAARMAESIEGGLKELVEMEKEKGNPFDQTDSGQ